MSDTEDYYTDPQCPDMIEGLTLTPQERHAWHEQFLIAFIDCDMGLEDARLCGNVVVQDMRDERP